MKYKLSIWQTILYSLVAIHLAFGVVCVYRSWFSRTRIAFVNYQTLQLGRIIKANDNPMIVIEELPLDRVAEVEDYDMVFINGMGLRITEEQRESVKMAALVGHPILTTAATNPANAIVGVDSLTADTLRAYLAGGSRANYRSMLNYIRTYVDGKVICQGDIDSVIPARRYLLEHADLDDADAEEVGFESIAEYEAYLKRHHIGLDGSHIIITGAMGSPHELCAALEREGYAAYILSNVNPSASLDVLDSIAPAAIVNFAHGRMGDAMVGYLQRANIPLFCPLNVNMLTEEWLDDKQGMQGGYLSQSLVVPEVDGAIRPYVLFAHRTNNDGLREVYALPERLDTFVKTLQGYINLRQKPNGEKKLAIVYFGNPQQNTLSASGLEGIPSLYNLLKRLKAEGYQVDNLPASVEDFRLARQDYGNIQVLPQPMAGEGTDTFAIVHGTGQDPTLAFQETYRWIREDFGADALLHFGTHGALEYTPRKQVALSGEDWPDRLIGHLPHFYIYTIGNVGEALIAKRRTYAGIQSHLTAPFMESELRGAYKELTSAIEQYERQPGDASARMVQKLAMAMGIHRDLRLDSLLDEPWSEEEIARVERFAEEIVNEKMTGQLYTLGEPYEAARITSSVVAMATDPIAYSLLALDKQMGRVSSDVERHQARFTRHYLNPARTLVNQLLNGELKANDALICRVAHISIDQLSKARKKEEDTKPLDMMAMMQMMSAVKGKKPKMEIRGADSAKCVTPGRGDKPDSASLVRMKEAGKNMDPRKSLAMAKMMGAPASALKKMAEAMGVKSTDVNSGGQDMTAMIDQFLPHYTEEEKAESHAVMEVCHTIMNVLNYRNSLIEAPEQEMTSLLNALNGGYTAPSSGGDVVSNPRTLPTGRNLYGVNAENTPSAQAWERGKALAESTLQMYRKAHHDSIPRKVSFTLWSSEFIETEGASIAQILYLLGVEPVRDAFGRVTDIRLIPSQELGRPRVDVVVQTSGQLRDLAASRLYLINRAVTMAAAASDDMFENQVAAGVLESERYLTAQGLSPKEAREMSSFRVFGGVNGNYGTGIQGMVQSQGGWQNTGEIADVYMNNMGAFYGSAEGWERYSKAAFAAALTRTDVVTQPRQSNTWGALSLDHVYEFMGGINLAVTQVTGKEPEAYMADYRNRNHNRMQELKEAVGVESRATIFNPAYIREKMKGGASAAAGFAEVVQNTYGWSVTRQSTIDPEMWQEIYDVYVADKFQLGIDRFIGQQNPAAMEQMANSMLQAADKGYFHATAQQHQQLEQIRRQARLQQQNFAAQQSETQKSGTVLRKETLMDSAETSTTFVTASVVIGIAVVVGIVILTVIRKRRRAEEEEE